MNTSITLLTAFLVALVACGPEEGVAPSPHVPIDGRAKFVGTYDVYDMVGNYGYSMEINLHPGSIIDSLILSNVAGAFDIYCQHDAQDPSNFIHINFNFGIPDHEGNRWAWFSEYDSLFMYNQLVRDTLRLSYRKSNIAFYVEDGVPYFARSYREYAVKRDWE